MASESWDLDDNQLEGARGPQRPTRPPMVMPRTQAVHAEPGFPARRPAFPQLPDRGIKAGESIAPTLRSSRQTAQSTPAPQLLPQRSSTLAAPLIRTSKE